MGITYLPQYARAARYAALITCITGATVMFGWLAGIETLKSIHPDFVSMKFNTCVCFILLGCATLIETYKSLQPIKFVSKLLATIVVLVGIMSFLQFFRLNFAIDQLFVRDTVAAAKGIPNPGRMPPHTALCFIFSGMALWCIDSEKRLLIRLCQFFLHTVTLISSIAFLGYLFSLPRLYSFQYTSSMALHTSITFIIFSAGASLLHPYTGITGLFAGKGIGNVMARRLIAWIAPVIIILGYIRNAIADANIMADELSIAMLSISFLFLCLVCIWITSKELNFIAHKEQQLQENFRMSIEASPYALVLSKQNGEIIHANYKAQKLFGFSRQELIGNNINIVIPEELRKDSEARRQRFFTNENTIRYTLEDEIYCKHKKGRVFPCEVILTPVKTAEGMLALASIIDATERKHSEELMQTQLRELQQKNMEMEQFSFIASHDLQEPLRTVSNYIMLLEEDYPEQFSGEVKEHLGTINDAVARMKKLIRNLLDFGRLGRNKSLVQTDIKSILKEAIADLKGLLQENNASIKYNPEELPELYAYETELRMLFQNLINNAVKFCKRNVPPKIAISCRSVDGYYEFAISDNGIGISEKHLEDIFNIFQRLHSNEEYQGYGIGLANCKKIAEMHGGKIWVESEQGKGSTFKFTILNLKI